MQKDELLESFLRGYKRENPSLYSPTIKYLKIGEQKLGLSEFTWFDCDNSKCLELCKKSLSFKDRITYGLPVDNEEFNHFRRTGLK